MRLPRRRKRTERLDALLRDVSTLRLTLDTDLTIAAAAAEADRFDVAAEMIDHDRTELAAFAERVAGRLEPTAEPGAPETVPRPRSDRGRKQRIAFAMAPAMLAVAAVVALFTIGSAQPRQTGVTRSDLMASYTAFSQLAASDSDPARLAAVCHQLNASVATLIAAAAHDPASASQAARILWAEQVLLAEHHPQGAAALLAQAQALLMQLQQAVPSSTLTVAPAPAGSPPSTQVLTVVIPPAAPSLPATLAPAHSPAPAASPAPVVPPAARPTPEPSAGDATVDPQPSPSPTWVEPWPFGDTGMGNKQP
jgi:hypothetical protein